MMTSAEVTTFTKLQAIVAPPTTASATAITAGTTEGRTTVSDTERL
jgi:hypothetical protein